MSKLDFNILLVDDEKSQRDVLEGFLTKKGYSVTQADCLKKGIELFENNSFDLLITDYKLPDGTGGDLLNKVKIINPNVQVILMTAYGSLDDAVGLMKKGAYDYMQKPIELDVLIKLIERIREHNLLVSENNILKQQLSEKHSFDSIIYQSGEMDAVMNIAWRIAKSKASVLLQGESGTGKELIAKAIHYSSDRADKPFIVINCSALPDTLFESELFGHEKGAFTGADKLRIGKFEMADKGTLFIDEVGDIPLNIQVKLLRTLQFGDIERLGGNNVIKTDVRIISATNRNLEKMIKAGEFREDLYYRINVVNINISPLRKRKTDIMPLINHFINKYSLSNNKSVKNVSKETADLLMKYNYPGNIRELENIIQRAVVLARDQMITTEDLPTALKEKNVSEKDSELISLLQINEMINFNENDLDMNRQIEDIETILINKALNYSGGNQVKAAQVLKISERTLRYKISKYRIKG